MKKTLLLWMLTAFVSAQAQDAMNLVNESMKAYGGGSWNKINFIKTHYYSHNYWLEQSENPEGPFITSYEDVFEIRSISDTKLYQKKESKHLLTIKPDTSELIVNNDYGMMRYGSFAMPFQPTSGFMDRSKSWLYYCPIKLLRTISGSALTHNGKVTLSGTPHHEIVFSSKELSGKILINANTRLLTEAYIESYWPSEYYFSIWGKFQTRIQYSLYSLHNGSKLYPHQWNITQNGQPWQQITFSQIEFLEKTNEEVFHISNEIKTKTQVPVKANDVKPTFEKIKEVAQGIKLIEGAWNTGWVEQEDGIVIVEAPISSGHSKSMIEEIKTRFPNKPLKGVIVTSDAWPHLGGAREYMAENVPIFTSYLNENILNKLARADYSIQPDLFDKRKSKPIFKWIQSRVTINDKNIPLTIYPVNGEGGERMVVVYFPRQKLLYASDLIQYLDPSQKIFFFPEYLNEVREVIKKNNLDVETIYAMHLEPTPWKEVTNFLDKLE
ncbi:MAG: MBL fold metallo-hydrolase [Cyclobacteriaceae bacterium]|nr:MBL fold metallo-hydrolase [Cyclobacteriaceae bacterium]